MDEEKYTQQELEKYIISLLKLLISKHGRIPIIRIIRVCFNLDMKTAKTLADFFQKDVIVKECFDFINQKFPGNSTSYDERKKLEALSKLYDAQRNERF